MFSLEGVNLELNMYQLKELKDLFYVELINSDFPYEKVYYTRSQKLILKNFEKIFS
jgi:hypothetical protein